MKVISQQFPIFDFRTSDTERPELLAIRLNNLFDELRTHLVDILNHIEASKTYNPPDVTSGSTTTTNVTVPGAALGDTVVFVTFSLGLQGMIMTGYVSAAGTVTVILYNPTGGAINLASGTLTVGVRK